MPKGRIFVPPTESDGIWFRHRGLPPADPLFRTLATSTGVMLNAPFDQKTSRYPPLPPDPYRNKEGNFKLSNNFSAHDNRHSFQDHGVYFEDGQTNRHLGKHITAPVKRQHFTEKDYLKHYSRTPISFEYHTIYNKDYIGKPTKEAPTKRRFPKNHPEGISGLAKLSSTTTDMFLESGVPYRTPLHVLAVSQEPLLPANKWKYSYNSLPKCYPSYDKVASNRPFPLWAHNTVESHAEQS